MAEIDESQQRIAQALTRIDVGIEALLAQGSDAADREELEATKAALAEERRVSEDLRAQIAEMEAHHAKALEAHSDTRSHRVRRARAETLEELPHS